MPVKQTYLILWALPLKGWSDVIGLCLDRGMPDCRMPVSLYVSNEWAELLPSLTWRRWIIYNFHTSRSQPHNVPCVEALCMCVCVCSMKCVLYCVLHVPTIRVGVQTCTSGQTYMCIYTILKFISVTHSARLFLYSWVWVCAHAKALESGWFLFLLSLPLELILHECMILTVLGKRLGCNCTIWKEITNRCQVRACVVCALRTSKYTVLQNVEEQTYHACSCMIFCDVTC